MVRKKIGVVKELEQEVQETEKWIIERKRFFIKLGLLVGFVALLLIFSHLYLRVKGFG